MRHCRLHATPCGYPVWATVRAAPWLLCSDTRCLSRPSQNTPHKVPLLQHTVFIWSNGHVYGRFHHAASNTWRPKAMMIKYNTGPGQDSLLGGHSLQPLRPLNIFRARIIRSRELPKMKKRNISKSFYNSLESHRQN